MTALPLEGALLGPLVLEPGVVSPTSLAALDAVRPSLGAASLLVLEVPEGDVGTLVGRRLAESLLLDPRAAALDVRVAVPEKDRWSVAEVDEQVISPAAFVPVERTVVVVAAADAMDSAPAEHLLKTVEEPPSGALFVFVVRDRSRLLPTILGRAGHVVRLDLAPLAERVAALVASGLDEGTAQEVTDLVGTNVALASAYAALEADREPVLADLRTAFRAGLRTSSPSSAAFELVTVLERLAALSVVPAPEEGAPTRKRRAPSKTALKSPQARAELRSLTRRLLAKWRLEVAGELRDVSDAAGHRRVSGALSALDAAELELSAYAPPAHVLAALFARTA